MGRVSIKNIAKLLGVSPATVSLVLNDKDKSGRISRELAQKVRETAKELNYTPNMSARSLRTRKTKTIGLIVADISNPFFAKLARHIENIAAQQDYQLIFGSSDESNIKFRKLVDVFIGKGVDGMIIVPPKGGNESLNIILNNKIPLVIVDRDSETIPINTVKMDNMKASYNLVNHLINDGCKRIGVIGHNKDFSNVIARYEGYTKALQENKIALNDDIVEFVELENFDEGINNAIDKLLKNKIDSIFFTTSKAGRESLAILKSKKLLDKFKYAGIDLFDECRLASMTLFSIEQSLDVMSDKALSILFKQIEDPKYETIEVISLHPASILTTDS